jgi:hypothetical protein
MSAAVTAPQRTHFVFFIVATPTIPAAAILARSARRAARPTARLEVGAAAL